MLTIVAVTMAMLTMILPDSFWFTPSGEIMIVTTVLFLAAYILRVILYFLTKPNYEDLFE